ncbi:KedN5 family methylcobalamin-dependent radical SAM C-methyltransferase [Crossiella cryophila]|uniref:Radical SAM superfamily enzyme YgiQ (UPF0313 family) n=1 Tax=Crossiella cryophila TaxID=43355 RepID=A0A7W7CKH5_9PSEU|nr:KedN5 family methylcobalamin-dependent radical SAM C-methyltransferase [Crossiella cryophila]MBB4681438.1 radical SAM superfamily enzyme YgiQ (UPF0313 family) [Crossiella cryophila]
MRASKRPQIWLVQQGVWKMALESLPLAAGYLKATALQDPEIAAQADIEIHSFGGGVTAFEIANTLFSDEPPDLIAFSVLGWNVRTFSSLAETYRQLRPDGWVVFGGNHVSDQAARVFGMCPEVDVVVNGEGELTFVELVRELLAGGRPHDLGHVAGVSYRDDSGMLRTTPDRPRIEDLDIIGSPFLTEAIPLTGADGTFRYDVAIMETNRGCPYKCSFCYWGGAVGQRVRAFSRDRLRAELEVLGRHRVHTIALCDANFGMLASDLEFIKDFIEVRSRYGYPRTVETSWAKNKSKVFYEIVRIMKEAGLHSSFTLALQTLDDDALNLMNRRNMKVNQWEELAEWLAAEGLQSYAELIWGAPGETVESFLEGYDRLAEHVSRVAAYPLLLLPNTEFSAKKEQYGLVTVRGDTDDFEHVLRHDTMSLADNRYMHQFLLFSRLLAESAVLRHTWPALRRLAGITQSTAIRSLMGFVAQDRSSVTSPFRHAMDNAFTDSNVLAPLLAYVYGVPAARDALRGWWRAEIRPGLDAEVTGTLDAVFDYDLRTLPAHLVEGQRPVPDCAHPGLPVVSVNGEQFHVDRAVRLPYHVPALTAALRRGEPISSVPRDLVTDIYYKAGAADYVTTTNHEEIIYYMGRLAGELR